LPRPARYGKRCGSGAVSPGRVMSVISGEVSAAAFAAAGTVAARPGQIAECEAAGLLTVVSGRELAVHRWTAEQLRHQLAEPGPSPARPGRRLRMAGAGALAVLSVVLVTRSDPT